MKFYLLIMTVFSLGSLYVYSDDAIFLPNLPADATGTKVGGKNALDVNVAASVPVTFPSSLPVTFSPIPLPVVIVSPTPARPNSNGNTSVVTVTGTEGSMAAPANAICLNLESESGNTIYMRWGVSNSSASILSSSVGQLMEPGRDIDPCLPIGVGSFIHYILVSAGSQPLDLTWILTQ